MGNQQRWTPTVGSAGSQNQALERRTGLSHRLEATSAEPLCKCEAAAKRKSNEVRLNIFLPIITLSAPITFYAKLLASICAEAIDLISLSACPWFLLFRVCVCCSLKRQFR